MTWYELSILISRLSTKEMCEQVTIVKDGAVYTADNLLINKNLIWTLDDGVPYLEVK